MDDETPQDAAGEDFAALAAQQPRESQEASPPVPFTEDQLQALRELGTLPAHEQQLLHGMAEWLNGSSLRQASKLAGCNYKTLQERLRKAGLTEQHREEVATSFKPLALAIYEEAGRQTLEQLRDGKDAAPKITWGIAADKLFKLLQVERSSPATGSGMLAKLTEHLEALGGGSLELTVRHNPPPPGAAAVTVQAVEEAK